MKQLFLASIGFLTILVFISCERGVVCNENDNKNLGQISYSEMNDFNTEKETSTLTLMRNSGLLELPLTNTSNSPNQWIDYKVCESVDVKPYSAYAYYEYENINRTFSNEDVLISIEPQILNNDGEELEVIYINLAHNNSSIKGIVPVDELGEYEPELDVFDFMGTISINNKTFYQSYLFEKDDLKIYYSKDQGIVGVNIDGLVYSK